MSRKGESVSILVRSVQVVAALVCWACRCAEMVPRFVAYLRLGSEQINDAINTRNYIRNTTRRTGEVLECKSLYRRAVVQEPSGTTWLVHVTRWQLLNKSQEPGYIRAERKTRGWRAGVSARSTRSGTPGYSANYDAMLASQEKFT